MSLKVSKHRRFLNKLDWHYIADVLGLTYFLMMCVHLMGYRQKNRTIVLRYVAFALSWLMKSKDGWDRIIYEAVLVSSFLLILAYRRILSEDPSKVSLRVLHVQWALLCLFVAFLLGCVLLFCDTGDHVELFVVLKSILHIVGVGYYQAWLAVPCLDSKKTDLMPHYDTFL